jgi:hypothetical protein
MEIQYFLEFVHAVILNIHAKNGMYCSFVSELKVLTHLSYLTEVHSDGGGPLLLISFALTSCIASEGTVYLCSQVKISFM